jgi:tRNA (cytidine32/guanosine34-2'-O)-methyltransferase
MGRASKDKRDIYYRKAKEEGYRARSAYKLLQIDELFDIFRGVSRAVDLCAAPGSWSQVLAARLPATPERRIVAVDLQEMAPIDGVCIVQGDITTEKTASTVISSLGDAPAQIVVCDGAPDVTGMHELDEYVQHQLLLAALNITTFVLERGGKFVAKIFRGPNTPFLVAKCELFFENVTIVKPKSSRNASMESFIFCENYMPPLGFIPSMIDPVVQLETFFPPDTAPDGVVPQNAELAAQASVIHKTIVKFLACGDLSGYDADMCYSRSDGAEVLAPSHPPTQAPYLPTKRTRGDSTAVDNGSLVASSNTDLT